MPRNIRNFWITVEVDGRQHNVETGPRAKNGGFIVRIYQRGAPSACESPVLTITGVCLDPTVYPTAPKGPALLETRVWIRPNTDQQHQIGFVKTDRGPDESIEWSPCK